MLSKLSHLLLLPLTVSVSAQNIISRSTPTITATGTIVSDTTIVVTSTRVLTEVDSRNATVTCISSAIAPPRMTVTEVSTSTNTITEVTVASETTTVTATVQTLRPDSVNYRRFTHSFDNKKANNGFTSSFFKDAPVLFSSLESKLSFGTKPRSPVNIMMSRGRFETFDSRQSALLFQGALLAKDTGTHSFSSRAVNTEDWAYLWIGDAAVGNNWNDTNTAYKAKSGAEGSIDGTVSFDLKAGDMMPFTYLWANTDGSAYSEFVYRIPGGRAFAELDQFLVRDCV